MKFLPFPTVFSKEFDCRHVKSRACLGKDYWQILFAYALSLHLSEHVLDVD